MQTALHAATVMLPDLRRGLSEESAKTRDAAPADADAGRRPSRSATAHVLAFEGVGHEHHHAGDDADPGSRAPAREDRLHVESQIRCEQPDCPLGAAIAAPLVVAR